MQVAHLVDSHASHLPLIKYFPSSQESQVPSVKQVLQSKLQLNIQVSYSVTQVAHLLLSHNSQAPSFKYLPSTQVVQLAVESQVKQSLLQSTIQVS